MGRYHLNTGSNKAWALSHTSIFVLPSAIKGFNNYLLIDILTLTLLNIDKNVLPAVICGFVHLWFDSRRLSTQLNSPSKIW